MDNDQSFCLSDNEGDYDEDILNESYLPAKRKADSPLSDSDNFTATQSKAKKKGKKEKQDMLNAKRKEEIAVREYFGSDEESQDE